MVSQQEAYEVIYFIKAEIGGFDGPSYQVKVDLDGGKVSSISSENIFDIQYHEDFSIAKHAINELRKNLFEAQLLEWKNRYENPYIFDGTSWQITIKLFHDQIIKSGNNEYPERWGTFCTAISKVSGLPFR